MFFSSATIWAIQIQVSYTELKNPKNPGIHPTYGQKWGPIFAPINTLDVIFGHLVMYLVMIEGILCVIIYDAADGGLKNH